MADRDAGKTEHIDAITLATVNMAESIEFYEALGFTVSYGNAASSFVTLDSGSCFVNLWQVKQEELPSGWWGRVIFHVDDVDLAYQRAVEAKFSPEGEPVDAPWGERFFAIRDPSGHDLSFAKRINN
ncbi:MAG: VOC family protein [Actinomycetota bacterium]|nr:VOC family protein [Actinomycetota bacterium]MED5362069.1 VOC family protein [Actinomycetota bacterium]MEE3255961.1 VOC family protein [Actinomycetota bacterium]